MPRGPVTAGKPRAAPLRQFGQLSEVHSAGDLAILVRRNHRSSLRLFGFDRPPPKDLTREARPDLTH
jgi:hypothetical protein